MDNGCADGSVDFDWSKDDLGHICQPSIAVRTLTVGGILAGLDV